MESSNRKVPVFDLEKVNIKLGDTAIDTATLQNVGKDLVRALTDVGFFYIKNHGIARDEINACSEAGKKFFDLPNPVKLARLRNMKRGPCGYIPIPGQGGENMPNEQFDASKPADYKEAINVCHLCEPSVWPDKELPELRPATVSIIKQAEQVVSRLLLLIGHGLTPEKPTCFNDGFKECGTAGNTSGIKFVHYAAAASESAAVGQGGMRCGEHTDLGLITLFFIDSTPGFQVFANKGEGYQDVDFIDDTIFVNIGDLFQRWTSDILHAAKHRVVFRPDTMTKGKYSLVYFSIPDSEAVISPVVEPLDQYPPIRTIDYYNRRIRDAFIKHKGIDSELHVQK